MPHDPQELLAVACSEWSRLLFADAGDVCFQLSVSDGVVRFQELTMCHVKVDHVGRIPGGSQAGSQAVKRFYLCDEMLTGGVLFQGRFLDQGQARYMLL